jgi:hypothetical protein
MTDTLLHFDHLARHFSKPGEIGHITATCLAECFKHPTGATADIAGFLRNEQGYEPAQALAVDSMVKYGYYGQQTFQIGPELQEMFCQTSLESVPREALLLPYPCFYLDLPKCPWKIWGGDRTGWHTLSGAYVMLKDDYLVIVMWGRENKSSAGIGDDATVWMKISLDECFTDHGDIENYLDWLLQPGQSSRMSNDSGVEGPSGMEIHLKQKEAYTNTYRVAINLILYLQTEAAETDKDKNNRAEDLTKKIARAKNPGKKKKHERQLAKLSKATIVKVGQTLEAKMAATRSLPGVRRAQWVRGHWHRYWTGKGRTTLTPRWIHPYPKNVDAEAVVEKRTYEVTQPPETP